MRQAVEERLLGRRGPAFAGATLGERVALEIEQLVELPAHLVERVVQVEVAVALAHLVPHLLEAARRGR